MKATKTVVVDVAVQVGDVISYKGGKPLLVVDYGQKVSADNVRNENYYANYMVCVDFESVKLGTTNPREHTFCMPGSSFMLPLAIRANDEDFELIEQRKFHKVVEVTYKLED